ncbi:adenylyl cyclase CyaB [Solidesulfovibrio fructosivorans JJ]]|uniref:Adenylyl cyclase CyaB n=1 Tax=Solidesulfovibrio fructosivorans JJ] TaxID=596151 RepID=E1K2H8_SOLFR|nr:class IV adenylate cyclase [Solidesulfovibrio fructosivorans]EFL49179.1 adenylyl cyclase CyaB [Solidesulfovibrio fructosivorans JJ]]
MSDADEIETKFAVTAFAPMREALAKAGGVRLSRVFEENIVFDTPDRALRHRDVLLRLRRDGEGRVTLKLPSETAVGSGIKVRREIETRVADPAVMESIFCALGYAPALRYEKIRETWQVGETHVCLDRLPFGRYLEIEGPAGTIAAVAEILGLSMADAIPLTYHALYQAHLAACGLPACDSFVFGPDERASVLSDLS